MNEIVPTGQAAVDARAEAAKARAETAAAHLELQRRADAAKAELAAQRAAMEAEFRAKMAEIEAAAAPVKAELNRLTEVGKTIDLYLGRDEDVALLRGGKPAPADTPLVIRSTVLYADEESLARIDSDGVDFRSMGDFLDWLVAAPENLDRVAPDQRCIVVVKPSRQGRDYGDAWMNATAMAENERPHWIIRNGERVYLLVTGVELNTGARIVPRVDEFTAMFTDRGVLLEPGSAAWVRAESLADAKRRHFMRLMLVIQGLVDRSACLLPQPDGGLNVMSLAAQDSGRVILLDEEAKALGDSRPPFARWQAALNAQLRKGLRVVVATSGRAFKSSNYRYLPKGGYDYSAQLRVSPNGCRSLPDNGVPHIIEAVDGQDFIIRFERTDEVWRRNVPVPGEPGWVYKEALSTPARRASLTVRPGDTWVLPFDLATRDDLAYYLNNRRDRRTYASMIPVLRAALRAKDAEEAAEAPFREFLAGKLDLDVDSSALSDLIHWWKSAHAQGRALTGDGPHEAKATKAILAEHARRVNAAARYADSDRVVVSAARSAVPDALAVLRLGSAYVALTVTDPDFGPWLTFHSFEADGSRGAVEPWRWLTERQLVTMDLLWSSDRWSAHQVRFARENHLTGPETDAFVREVLAASAAAIGGTPIGVAQVRRQSSNEESVARCFEAYSWKPDADFAGLSDHEDLVQCFVVTWKRGRDGGVHIDKTKVARGGWSRYADPSRPWREQGSRFYKIESSTKMAWCDPDQVALMDQYRAAARARRNQQRKEQDAFRRQTCEVVNRLVGAMVAHRTAATRAAFEVDFGADASDDLWQHHLGTLRLKDKIKTPFWVDSLVGASLRAGIRLDGRSVRDLVEVYNRDLSTKPILDADQEWLDLVVPLVNRGDS